MFLKSLSLANILSYGPDHQELDLHDMNICIGANGSGKSNLFDAISLLRSASTSLVTTIRRGGGVSDWLWKGSNQPSEASISFVTAPKWSYCGRPFNDMRYTLSFNVSNNRFEIIKEEIFAASPKPGKSIPYCYYQHNTQTSFIKQCTINNACLDRPLERKTIDPESSVFAQFKDPVSYPEITQLGKMLSQIKLYREWHFGIDCPMRHPQPTDGDASCLAADCSNLALVFNTLLSMPVTRKKIQQYVKNIYEGADEVNVQIVGGRAITQIVEDCLTTPIPANRLSDGSLRYLCLMAILLNPEPYPLVCLDEPELGMHPDLINSLAEMIKEAAAHSQIIINTHSPILMDAFGDYARDVIVCTKQEGCTKMEHLTQHELELLKDQSLGTLWMRGEIGGTRW